MPCSSRSFRAESYQFTVFATNFHFLSTVDGSEGNKVCLLYYFLTLLTKSIKLQWDVKRVNFGDGQGLQIPCTIFFKGEEKCIEVLEKTANLYPL